MKRETTKPRRVSVLIGDLSQKPRIIQELLKSDQYKPIRGQAIWALVALGEQALTRELSGPHRKMSPTAIQLTELLPAALVMGLRKAAEDDFSSPATEQTLQGSAMGHQGEIPTTPNGSGNPVPAIEPASPSPALETATAVSEMNTPNNEEVDQKIKAVKNASSLLFGQ